MPVRLPSPSVMPTQPKTLGRHFQHRNRHLGAERTSGTDVPLCMTSRVNFKQRAEPSAGMQQAEIHRGEAAAFQ